MTRVFRDGRVYRGDLGASARKAHRTRRQAELDAGKTLSKRTIGVEIEYHSEFPVTKLRVAEALDVALGEHVHVTGYHGDTCLRCGGRVDYKKWKIEHDGSLHPQGRGLDSTTGEVVSPVLVGQKGIDTLKLVMKTLREAGATIKPTCGLHVHVGVRDLDQHGLSRLVRTWWTREVEFYSLIPKGRRRNGFCKPWRRAYSVPTATADRIITGGAPSESWEKYTGLNLRPLARLGTVEFRLHGGTLNGTKAEAWIQFLLGFVDAMTDRPTEDTALDLPTGTTLWDYLVAEKYLPKKAGDKMSARALQYR